MQKTRSFTQLTEADRMQLYTLLGQGQTQKYAAYVLGCDPSTISRELARNKNEKLDEYLPDTAERKAQLRKKTVRKRRYTDKLPKLKKQIRKMLIDKQWSPEIISRKLKGVAYSHESVYQYIYSLEGRQDNLRQYLRQAHRIRLKMRGRRSRKTKILFRVGIEKRPDHIDNRRQFGHWEHDSVLYQGSSQVVATMQERKTRKLEVVKQSDKSAKTRRITVNRRFAQRPRAARRTMTFDNGTENAEHHRMAKTLGLKTYFTDTHSPWQKGSLENVHTLLRWFLPKGTDMNTVSQAELDRIVNKINNRPRKCLGWKTPNQAYKIEMDKIRKKTNKLNK